jgi:acetyltransferase-like isoleucine patch superfamily enzyme
MMMLRLVFNLMARRYVQIKIKRKANVSVRGEVRGAGVVVIGDKWGPFHYPMRTQFLTSSGSELSVSGRFSIYGGGFVGVGKGAKLSLGSGYASPHLFLSCADSISIGDDVAIADYVIIRDHDGHEITDGRLSKAPIVIGSHVWIGMRAVILKGVTIGDGAIIGAGAIVTKNVAANTLVVGPPAGFKRQAHWQ